MNESAPSRFLVCALLAFAVSSMGETIPKVWNDFGVRSISLEEDNRSADFSSETKTKYAILALRPNLGVKGKMNLEQKGNIRFVEPYSRDGEYTLYVVQLSDKMGETRQRLRSCANYQGITPYYKKDRVTRKIWDRSGFQPGEIDTSSGLVHASVVLFRGTANRFTDTVVASYCDTIWHKQGNGRQLFVDCLPEHLLELSEYDFIKKISEIDVRARPLNDVGRQQVNVDVIQQFDTSSMVFPPTVAPYWLPDTSYTGEGIFVGVYDSRIDSAVLDFCEVNVAGDTVLRKAPGFYWDQNLPWDWTTDTLKKAHGTHVAGTIGGNGWQSAEEGGTRYQWRGIAPRASLISRYYNIIGNAGDVNNHSHALDTSAYYTYYDGSVDDALYPPGPDQNIMIYAAANNGRYAGYGTQRGYYSLLANAKNCITVGATYTKEYYEEQPILCEFSSLGPTRDGRIKPDIVAPGAAHISPRGSANDPIVVTIDSIAFLGAASVEKFAWDFSTGTQGWSNPAAYVEEHYVDVDSVPGNLVMRITSYGAYSWSDSTEKLATPPECDLDDTLVIRYNVVLPSQLQQDSLPCIMMWRVDNNTVVRGSVRFSLATGAGYHTIRTALRDLPGAAHGVSWSGAYGGGGFTDSLVAIRLEFPVDTANGIRSALATPYGGGYRANGFTGTSMAAPHVTGVVALMLEKYERVYLQPRGLSVRTNAFWNSTAKALLIHTAEDLVKTVAYGGEKNNPDIGGPVVYYQGPDYATGWGLVNAKDAMAYIDSSLSRFSEDSVDQGEVVIYKAQNSLGEELRATIAWDDPSSSTTSRSTCHDIKLMSDLDLRVLDPNRETTHLPWFLDTLPHSADLPSDGIDVTLQINDIKPATRGTDRRNNVEVVDVVYPSSGEYSLIIEGYHVATVGRPQHFSIVSDDSLWRDASSSDLINSIRSAGADDTITVGTASYDMVVSAVVPPDSQNVTIIFQGGDLILSRNSVLSVGSTGSIVGAESILTGEYYTVDINADGSINEIGGAASFVGTSAAPCGTVYSSQNILVAQAAMSGCARNYTAEGSVTIGSGTNIGDETTIKVN